MSGSLRIAAVDSGPERTLVDATHAGSPGVERPLWKADGRTIYFKSHDARGAASIWSVGAAGGSPRLVVRFDEPARPSYRPQWALGRDRAYFPVEDRRSDIWVMEVEVR